MQYRLKINNIPTTLEQGKQYDVEGSRVQQAQGWSGGTRTTNLSFSGTLVDYTSGAYGNMLSFSDVQTRAGTQEKEFKIRLEEVVTIAEAQGIAGKVK